MCKYLAFVWEITLFQLRFLPVIERILCVLAAKHNSEKKGNVGSLLFQYTVYLFKYCYKCGIFPEL